MKRAIAFVLVMLFSALTFANGSDTGHNNGNGHRDDTGGGSQVTDITNRNTNHNNSTGVGVGVGIGVGGGAEVDNTNENRNTNNNNAVAIGGGADVNNRVGVRVGGDTNSNSVSGYNDVNSTNNVNSQGGAGGQGGMGGSASARGGDQQQSQSNRQKQNNRQGQRQGIASNINNKAVGSGNKTTVSNINNTDTSDTYKKYTPSAYAAPVVATTKCYVGMSGGIGVPGLSASIAGFRYDEECEHRETIRLAQGSQDPEVRALADMALTYKLEEIVAKEKAEEPKEAKKSTGSSWSWPSHTSIPSSSDGPNNLSEWH